MKKGRCSLFLMKLDLLVVYFIISRYDIKVTLTVNIINISDAVEIGKTILYLIFATGFAHILHYDLQDNNKNNQRKLEKQNSLPHNPIKSHMTSVSKSIVQPA